MTTNVASGARNATLQDLAALLQAQHTRKLDVVAPASTIKASDGRLVIIGAEPILGEDGVTPADGSYLPTDICDAQIADKLGIPVVYLRRMRVARPDLYDANVNGWLHDRDGEDGDRRSFLVRCFRGDETGEGIARAWLSDRYGLIDNLDVLMATLDGVRRAGVEVEIDGCDLTDSRMYVRVVAPQVAAMAPDLLAGYRTPFTDGGAQRAGQWDLSVGGGGWTIPRALQAAQAEGKGYEPGAEPVVFAGFVITNSETGGGAFTITPRIVVQICHNGLTMTADALRAVHIGAKLQQGAIDWSADTQRKALDLVVAQSRDAVAKFLDVDYVKAKVAELEDAAGAKVDDAVKTIATIGKTLNFTEAEQASILEHFFTAGQRTAGGIMHAVTSVAQTIESGDRAHELEAVAVRAMHLAGAR